MRSSLLTVLGVLLICVSVPACQREADTAPALVTPTVTLSRSDVGVGTPIEMTYHFEVAPGATLGEDYLVFVHFVDADRELMWTDDHMPPVPTSQWKPGAPVEYSRTVFVPKFPYAGEASVELGLYSAATGERVPMAGDNQGQRSYRVAGLTMGTQTNNLFVVFKDGWQDAEISNEGAGIEWQWSKKAGIVAFRNPKRDAVFYLQVDQPVPQVGMQHVDVRMGDAVIDSFDLPPGELVLRKIPLTQEQFGDEETGEITIEAEKTFVPAEMPELKSNDARELGVRVMRAYLQPS